MIRINLLAADRATKKKAVTLQVGQKLTIGCSLILILAGLFVGWTRSFSRCSSSSSARRSCNSASC
jgi:hypothetical protein